jgi:hypothetical protein
MNAPTLLRLSSLRSTNIMPLAFRLCPECSSRNGTASAEPRCSRRQIINIISVQIVIYLQILDFGDPSQVYMPTHIELILYILSVAYDHISHWSTGQPDPLADSELRLDQILI